jgi:hypothetical protein
LFGLKELADEKFLLIADRNDHEGNGETLPVQEIKVMLNGLELADRDIIKMLLGDANPHVGWNEIHFKVINTK